MDADGDHGSAAKGSVIRTDLEVAGCGLVCTTEHM